MKTYRLRPFAAAVTLALACAGVAHAADSSAPDAPAADSSAMGSSTSPATTPHGGRHMHKDAHHHWSRNAVMIPGIGIISQKQIAELKLNADQQKLVQNAQDEQKTLRDSMKKAWQDRHAQLAAQLAANKLDPHALVAQSDAGRGQFKSSMDSVRDKWLAVWDSFSPAQRQTVQKIVAAREARMAKHHRHHHAAPASAPAAAAS